MERNRGGQSQGPGAAYRDYTVYDRHYEKVGRVDDLFVDENDRPEYIGVKMGFLGTRSTLIPVEMVRVNERRHLVEVAADEETIKHAPTFHDDRDITPEYEHGVYRYFGLEPPAPERSSNAYGGYYASDAGAYRDAYREEELRRKVDTEYGERADSPMAKPPSGGSREVNLDVPLDDAGLGETGGRPPRDETVEPARDPFDADAAVRTGGNRRDEIKVAGDRNVRVFKRTRATRR